MKNFRIIIQLTWLAIFASGCSTVKLIREEDKMNSAVTTIKAGHVNMYLIKTSSGYILVDAGFPVNGKGQINNALSKAEITPGDLKLIIVTHAHPDHAGALAYIRGKSNAPVVCHKSAEYYLANGTTSPIVPRNAFGRFLNFFTSGKFNAVKPDITFDEEFDLDEYGINGKIVHTPGHTAGSSTIVLDNGEMLVGDMIRGDFPETNAGMFYEDLGVLIKSLDKLTGYNSDTIYMSHSGTITGKEFEQVISKLKEQSADSNYQYDVR